MSEQEKFFKMLREILTVFLVTWGLCGLVFLGLIAWHTFT